MDLVQDRGSMDPVHESGPWTRSKVGGPWTLVHVLSSPTLDRVPWFGRHVENLGDVIIYPVLVVARTGLFIYTERN